MTPASCTTCGKSASNSRETFADPQNYVEFFGNIYFCENCALELAAVFGAFTKSEFDAVEQERDTLLAHNAVLHSHVQKLERTIDGLSRSWLATRSIISSTDTELPFDTTVIEQTESRDDRLPESIPQDGAGQSTEPNQPSTDEGPTDPSRSDPDFNRFLNNI